MTATISKKKLTAVLEKKEPKDLIGIIAGLYDVSDDNKVFLTMRLSDAWDRKKLLKPYKEIISRNMCFQDFGDEVSTENAEKAISDYEKASGGDDKGVLELMVYYLETGTNCTVEYGDMWESFYDSLASVGFQIVKKIKSGKFSDAYVRTLKPRFRKLRDLSDGIGWGFGDDLKEIYYQLFGD